MIVSGGFFRRWGCASTALRRSAARRCGIPRAGLPPRTVRRRGQQQPAQAVVEDRLVVRRIDGPGPGDSLTHRDGRAAQDGSHGIGDRVVRVEDHHRLQVRAIGGECGEDAAVPDDVHHPLGDRQSSSAGRSRSQRTNSVQNSSSAARANSSGSCAVMGRACARQRTAVQGVGHRRPGLMGPEVDSSGSPRAGVGATAPDRSTFRGGRARGAARSPRCRPQRHRGAGAPGE